MLKLLFTNSKYRDMVRDVVENAGAAENMYESIFEKTLILLDRTIRRLRKVESSVSEFFRSESIGFWCRQMQSSELIRNNVIRDLSEDEELKGKIIANIVRNQGRQEDAEDCYQNGLIRVNEQLTAGKFRGGAIKGYLYTTCFNLWRNELKRNRPSSLDEEYEKESVGNNPHLELENLERKELLDNAFQQLGEMCRKLLELKYFISDQFSMDQIAEQTGYKNAQNASNALAKCRKKLWELLQTVEGNEYIWKIDT